MVSRPRFVPDRDVSDTRIHIPPSTVRYSDLHSSLKERIDADVTEHELLEWIIITVQKINKHMYEITDEEITKEDISWL